MGSNQASQKDCKARPNIQSNIRRSVRNTTKTEKNLAMIADESEMSGQAGTLGHLSGTQRQTIAMQIEQSQGNRILRHVMVSLKRSNSAPQTKPTVSEPSDQYEQEADRVANQAMTMAASPTPPSGGDETTLKRYAQPAGNNIGGSQITPGIESGIQAMQHGGQALPQSERDFFEPRMGVDLGYVKVHNDDQAAETADNLNAQAYTVGSDVAFDKGKYAPGSTDRRRLLAHELTHVVQQTGGKQ